MEEYRSQPSELPSDGEAKRIADNFFQWTENLNKGDSMYSELLYCNEHNLRLQNQINSYVASKDARIKELEEALKDSQIIMKNLKHNAKDSSAPIYFGGVSLDKALDTNWNLIKTITPPKPNP